LKIKIILSFFIVLGLTFGLLTGCNDEPTSLGSNLLKDSDLINLRVIDSDTTSGFVQKYSTFRDSILTGSSTRILLGKIGNLESKVLIKFFIPVLDSIATAVKNNEVNVVDSWIELTPNYSIGDTSVPLRFTAHVINSKWSSNKFNSDSLADLDYDQTDVTNGFYDTDSTISFHISTTVAMDWLKRRVDSNLNDDNGLLLIPTSDNIVLGFQAITQFPQSVYPTLKIVVEKVGSFTDTLSATPTRDIHIVSGETPVNTGQSIILEDGIANRAKVWIDFSSIPKFSIINKATLTFKIDKDNSLEGSVKSDTLNLFFYNDSASNKIAPTNEIGKVNLIRNNTDGTYSGDISGFVQRWVDGRKNQGFRLNLSDENRALSKVALFDNRAPKEKQPHLLIYITERN